jgi:hypothetical protein
MSLMIRDNTMSFSLRLSANTTSLISCKDTIEGR